MGLFHNIKNIYTGNTDPLKPEPKKRNGYKKVGATINTEPISYYFSPGFTLPDVEGLLDKIALQISGQKLNMTKNGDTLPKSTYGNQLFYSMSDCQTFPQWIYLATLQALRYGDSFSYIEKNDYGEVVSVQLLKRGDIRGVKYRGNDVFYSVESLNDDIHASQLVILNLKEPLTKYANGVYDIVKDLQKVDQTLKNAITSDNKRTNGQSLVVSFSDTMNADFMSSQSLPRFDGSDLVLNAEEDEEGEDIKAEVLKEGVRFLEAGSGVLLEEDGRKFRTIEHKTTRPDLTAVDTYIRTKIATLYGVPVSMFCPKSGTKTKEEHEAFSKEVLLPYLVQIEAELNRKLLSPQSRKEGYAIQFSKLRHLILLDSSSVKALIRSGVATQNEIRAELGLSNIGEKGDLLHISRDIKDDDEEGTINIHQKDN